MRIVKENEYQMQYPMIEVVKQGTAFEYDGRFFIKTDVDIGNCDFRWKAVDLNNGEVVSFKTETRVRPLDAKVVIG